MFPPNKDFHWVSPLRRTRDPRREEAFAGLEDTISVLTEKHFPLARVRKRSVKESQQSAIAGDFDVLS